MRAAEASGHAVPRRRRPSWSPEAAREVRRKRTVRRASFRIIDLLLEYSRFIPAESGRLARRRRASRPATSNGGRARRAPAAGETPALLMVSLLQQPPAFWRFCMD